jgi:DNA-binding NarL/FixJ family response regulator
MRAGASGFVLKDAAGQELVAAVRTLYAGGRFFSSKISAIDKNYGKQRGKGAQNNSA